MPNLPLKAAGDVVDDVQTGKAVNESEVQTPPDVKPLANSRELTLKANSLSFMCE